MGLSDFEKALDEAVKSQELETPWGRILLICDFISESKIPPKQAIQSIIRKIFDQDPHVSIRALEVLDSCISNCGSPFHLEFCSRDVVNELRRIITKARPEIQERTKKYLQKWAEDDFSKDTKFSLMPSFYRQLKSEGVRFPADQKGTTANPRDLQAQKMEEEELMKALELSLLESTAPPNRQTSNNNSTLYPSIADNANRSTVSSNMHNGASTKTATQGAAAENASKQTQGYKVRALYDFEAAEDNEITFKAGELIIVLDDSDVNWWKGSNHRGEGLFPSNFVSKNLDSEPELEYKHEKKKSVQFNEDVQIVQWPEEQVVKIDEPKIDRLSYLLHEADPTGERVDSQELLQLEEQCIKMSPLIDTEMERIDKQHAALTVLDNELKEALNLYCSLMKPATTSFPPVQPITSNQYYPYMPQQHMQQPHQAYYSSMLPGEPQQQPALMPPAGPVAYNPQVGAMMINVAQGIYDPNMVHYPQTDAGVHAVSTPIATTGIANQHPQQSTTSQPAPASIAQSDYAHVQTNHPPSM